jgi:queuine tRNA-ribosyltransferase
MIPMFNFKIIAKDKKSRARTGVIETPHGIVETPAYTIVGTNAAVRTLKPEDLPVTGTQLIIANTYHIWRELGDRLESFEGLHKRMGFNGAIMTDSGGFQVFSLGFAREHGVSKVLNGESGRQGINLTRITDDGVFFHDDDRELFLNPEISIGIQEKLGADIIFAFDECTSPLNDYEYNKLALARTHAWAKRCLAAKKRGDQALYGIVQGGEWRDLREESARFIGSLPFPGFGIGGSFGKEAMLDVLRWTLPLLPEEKPRHLLGIGRIDDVFNAVELGIDTFDCVIPTREARHGSIWTIEGRYDVKKGRYAGDKKPLAKNCACPVCASGKTRGEIRALFQAGDHEAGHLATMHNVWFFNDLMRQIRESIKEGKFNGFKKKTLANLRQ